MPPRSPQQRKGFYTAVDAKRSPHANNKPGKIHAHKCVTCGLRYEDVCQTPAINGECGCTLPNHVRPVWLRDKDPQDCCRLYSQPLTHPAVLERYALAGDSGWWQCAKCFRSFPNDPRE